ncbi:ribonuclease Z, partial [bacterium]|nr:ribonuclease Z [bacterium]
MKLTILGSGSWWAQAERMGPAFLIEHAGFRALVDCGEGCLRRLAGAGVEPSSLNAILLTHDHPDHIAGLLPLLVGLHVQKMMGHPAARTEAMAFIGPPRIDRLLA